MATRNPFRVAEKVGNIVGYTLVTVFAAVAVAVVVTVAIRDFGWWALLIIPGIPAAIIVAGLIAGGTYAIGHQWRAAKYRWDQKHADEEVLR